MGWCVQKRYRLCFWAVQCTYFMHVRYCITVHTMRASDCNQLRRRFLSSWHETDSEYISMWDGSGGRVSLRPTRLTLWQFQSRKIRGSAPMDGYRGSKIVKGSLTLWYVPLGDGVFYVGYFPKSCLFVAFLFRQRDRLLHNFPASTSVE